MADQRLTDLSVGQLGKPTYSTELGWSFSSDVSLIQNIQSLLPIEQWYPASIVAAQEDHNSRASRSSLKNLTRRYPELASGIGVATELEQLPDNLGQEDVSGSLISQGRAIDHGSISGSRTPVILAMPCGDAGHILRICRPGFEKRGWGKDSDVILPVFVKEASDEGLYKIGTGGTIQQVAFANEENGDGTWLAIRQRDAITIFRVIYSFDDFSPNASKVVAIRPSHLKPGSLATLPSTSSICSTHVDVTFNPLYNRQIAVVDALGYWGIWDMEGRHGQDSLFRLVQGKSGWLYDGNTPELLQEPHRTFDKDSWHRIMWVCDIDTILVCNRDYLVLFNLKGAPMSIPATEFLQTIGIDQILDVKRCASNLNKVFVLTTTRIFWLGITAIDQLSNREGGVKVLLSYKHFRDRLDRSMKLATMKDNHISVLIYSDKTSLVSSYCFVIDEEGYGKCRSAERSFLLSGESNEGNRDIALRSAFFLPVQLAPRTSVERIGPEPRYLKHGVRCFQAWLLSTDLSLKSTLFTIQARRDDDEEVILVPETKLSRTLRRPGPRYVLEPFVVLGKLGNRSKVSRRPQRRYGFINDDDRLMDWRRIFHKVFLRDRLNKSSATSIRTTLHGVFEHIRQASKEGRLRMETILKLCGAFDVHENLDEVSDALNGNFASLPNDEEHAQLAVINLANCPGLEDVSSATVSTVPPQLMSIYEVLVDYWIGSLPLTVPNSIRGARFKIIRQVAVELLFSSIAILHQNRDLSALNATFGQVSNREAGIEGVVTRDSSPTSFYSAKTFTTAEDRSRSDLATSTRTPPYAASTSSEVTEDSAITRLRQYAVSIGTRPNIGRPKLFSEWPSFPGVDPATYSYVPPALDDVDGLELKAEKEAARRRKRTEKFLRRTDTASRGSTTPLGSQTPFDSQPTEDCPPVFSSQIVEQLPMTQPDRGTFGSRVIKGKKKQQKKHRAAGF